MGDRSFIDRGVSHANQAIKLDRAALASKGDKALYDQAYQQYLKAIEYYRAAIRFEKNPRTQEVLQTKCMEYLKRAEIMRDWLEKAEKRGTTQGSTGGTASMARPKGDNGGDAGGDEEEGDPEAEKMRTALESAIVTEKPNVKWSDVAGLTGAKEALKEAVILPKKFPQMFTGKREPWKGILMYGPPGTGKSFLAKALATESDAYFFSVSSSDLMSKWQGESERLVKQLFSMAREKKNSIVFIDEIDSLVSSRSETDSESSRRVKTEFLVQMDGVGKGSDGVLVLGATNIPWGLDDALLRRMERRVYIPLPDAIARTTMLRMHFKGCDHTLSDANFRELGRLSEGYSGSDLKTVCRDTLMLQMRLSTQATHFKRVMKDGQEKYIACSPGDRGAIEMGLMSVPSDKLIEPPIQVQHVMTSFRSSKPATGKEELAAYEKFTREKGQEGR